MEVVDKLGEVDDRERIMDVLRPHSRTDVAQAVIFFYLFIYF